MKTTLTLKVYIPIHTLAIHRIILKKAPIFRKQEQIPGSFTPFDYPNLRQEAIIQKKRSVIHNGTFFHISYSRSKSTLPAIPGFVIS